MTEVTLPAKDPQRFRFLALLDEGHIAVGAAAIDRQFGFVLGLPNSLGCCICPEVCPGQNECPGLLCI